MFYNSRNTSRVYWEISEDAYMRVNSILLSGMDARAIDSKIKLAERNLAGIRLQYGYLRRIQETRNSRLKFRRDMA